MPYPWRVVIADCPASEPGEILCSGHGIVHEAMSAAYALRLDHGPEVGLGVEYLYGPNGLRWLRYAYLSTDGQREIAAELLRRKYIEDTRVRLAAIKPKKKPVRKDKTRSMGVLPDG